MFHYILISVSIMGTCYENYIEGIWRGNGEKKIPLFS
jgi:hypothetical protein